MATITTLLEAGEPVDLSRLGALPAVVYFLQSGGPSLLAMWEGPGQPDLSSGSGRIIIRQGESWLLRIDEGESIYVWSMGGPCHITINRTIG